MNIVLNPSNLSTSRYNADKIKITDKTYDLNFLGTRTSFSDKFDKIINKTSISDIDKKEIYELLKKEMERVFSGGSFLGRGKNNSVYKIDDEYVARMGLFNGFKLGEFSKVFNHDVINKLKFYYGKVYAKIGSVQIQKNALINNKGLNAGVPVDMKKASKIVNYYRDVYLPEFASLPQRAYDGIAADFKLLNSASDNNGYFKFDVINPNNFIKTGDEIRIVDNITHVDVKNYNNLNKMLDLFTKSTGVNAEIGFDKNMVTNRKIIYKKCILASEKSELPFYAEPQELSELKRSTKLAGIKEDFSDIMSKLLEFREKYTDMTKRLNAVNDYLETL